MTVLHIIDSIDYSGSARQLLLLAKAQVDSTMVCCLGAETSWSAALREAGVKVHVLGWTRWLDFSAWWNLRSLVRDLAPDVIHAWRPLALRVLATVAPSFLPRVVMSGPLSSRGEFGWLDQTLAGRIGRLAVAGNTDRDQCIRLGIAPSMLRVVSPAVMAADGDRRHHALREESDTWSVNPTTAVSEQPDHSGEFIIAFVGNLERDEGCRQAIWAFDFLRQLYTNARLHVVGAGSQYDDARGLAHGLECAPQVDFLGELSNTTRVLQNADVVWVPSMANCGRQTALDAMALGGPVVGSDVPCLREMIRDGETGILTPVADIVQLARRTHALLQNAALRARIGQSAQAWVRQHCDLTTAVSRWNEIYQEIAA